MRRIQKKDFEPTRDVELLLENLLFNRNNDQKNRYLQIRWNEKVDIEQKKWTLIRKKWTLKKLKSLKQQKKVSNISTIISIVERNIFQNFGLLERV